MDSVETIDYKGWTIEVYLDPEPESPREWDNLSVFALTHSRYDLPNEAGIDFDDFDTIEELIEHLRNEHDAAVILPVYSYEHGGITFSTGGFSCPWDSGICGVAFITNAKVAEEYASSGGRTEEELASYIDGEVKTFAQWSEGMVYGYTTEGPDEETGDSCWGFYDEADAISEAKGSVDYEVEAAAKQAAELAAEKAEQLAIAQRWATAMKGAA